MVRMYAVLLGVLGAASGTGVQWIRQEASVPVHDPESSSWLKGDRAPAEELMSLVVVLHIGEERLQELERTFFEVSDPRHVRYGQHLSLQEVTDLLAVPEERAARIATYFRDAGAASVVATPNADMLEVTAAVSVVEATLNTTIHAFTHRQRPSARLLRAGAPYWLPAGVAEEVTMVGELMQFPRLPQRLQDTGAPSYEAATWPNDCDAPECEGKVTPGVIAQRYKLPDDTGSPAGNTMAVAEFQGQYFKKHDVQRFASSCHRNVTVSAVIGGNKPRPGEESELDIEYIAAVAPSVPLTVIYQEDYSLIKWATAITQASNPILLHSVSYGNDEKQQSSKEYMQTCNTAFMKAGARGISILFASGDMGVCGRSGCGKSKVRFNPDFPAASPYITAVGGTDFLQKGVIGDETSWSASGGGFSDAFPMPDYQKEAVQAYVQDPEADLPPSSMWNAQGRGYPDVAALGGVKNFYCIASNKRFTGIAGTSASCPVVAGVFARLNGVRLAAGKPALGFLNPLIYQNGGAFQDVTHGKNSAGTKNGFKAIKGWDPATGFGTPDFDALAKVVAGLGAEMEIVV